MKSVHHFFNIFILFLVLFCLFFHIKAVSLVAALEAEVHSDPRGFPNVKHIVRICSHVWPAILRTPPLFSSVFMFTTLCCADDVFFLCRPFQVARARCVHARAGI